MTARNRNGAEQRRIGRVGVVVEDRYRAQAQPRGMVAALRTHAGINVVDVGSTDDLDRCDVLVARGRSEAVISLLAAAEDRGLRTVNSSSAVRSVLDKIVMHRRLIDVGITVPETWTGPFDVLRDQLADHREALVIKPVFGDNCRDVIVLQDGKALSALAWREPCAIVQRHIPNDCFDVKLYGIGDEVWAVRKPSPLYSPGKRSTLLVAPASYVKLAHRCRDAFGLDLYGVDCIDTTDGLVVIEVNDFPNYTGIAGADQRLARFASSVLEHDLVVAQ